MMVRSRSYWRPTTQVRKARRRSMRSTSHHGRCDAQSSPRRGYLYHPSRHSAGRSIVAGWAYQFVARLGFERDSWVMPVNTRRVEPHEDTGKVAAEQAAYLSRIRSADERTRTADLTS
jgi:hypothetical protein